MYINMYMYAHILIYIHVEIDIYMGGRWRCMHVQKNTLSFTSPGKDFFFRIHEVITWEKVQKKLCQSLVRRCWCIRVHVYCTLVYARVCVSSSSYEYTHTFWLSILLLIWNVSCLPYDVHPPPHLGIHTLSVSQSSCILFFPPQFLFAPLSLLLMFVRRLTLGHSTVM